MLKPIGPFAGRAWITAAAEIQQNLRKQYFPGSKWIAGNILCIGFFFDSGRCFYSMYRFFWPIPEDASGGRNYRFCILCMPSRLYINAKLYSQCFPGANLPRCQSSSFSSPSAGSCTPLGIGPGPVPMSRRRCQAGRSGCRGSVTWFSSTSWSHWDAGPGCWKLKVERRKI